MRGRSANRTNDVTRRDGVLQFGSFSNTYYGIYQLTVSIDAFNTCELSSYPTDINWVNYSDFSIS